MYHLQIRRSRRSFHSYDIYSTEVHKYIFKTSRDKLERLLNRSRVGLRDK